MKKNSKYSFNLDQSFTNLNLYHSPPNRQNGINVSPLVAVQNRFRNSSTKSSHNYQKLSTQISSSNNEKLHKIKFSVSTLEFTLSLSQNKLEIKGFCIKSCQNEGILLVSSSFKLSRNLVIFDKSQVLEFKEGSKLQLELFVLYQTGERLIGIGLIDFMTYQAFSLEKIPLYNKDKQLIAFLEFKIEVMLMNQSNIRSSNFQKRRVKTDKSCLLDNSSQIQSNLFTQIFQENKEQQQRQIPIPIPQIKESDKRPQQLAQLDQNLDMMLTYLDEIENTSSIQYENTRLMKLNAEKEVSKQAQQISRLNSESQEIQKDILMEQQRYRDLQTQAQNQYNEHLKMNLINEIHKKQEKINKQSNQVSNMAKRPYTSKTKLTVRSLNRSIDVKKLNESDDFKEKLENLKKIKQASYNKNQNGFKV